MSIGNKILRLILNWGSCLMRLRIKRYLQIIWLLTDRKDRTILIKMTMFIHLNLKKLIKLEKLVRQAKVEKLVVQVKHLLLQNVNFNHYFRMICKFKSQQTVPYQPQQISLKNQPNQMLDNISQEDLVSIYQHLKRRMLLGIITIGNTKSNKSNK